RTSVLDADPSTSVSDVARPTPSRPNQLALAGTFTIEGIVPSLQMVLEEAGLALDVVCAPYHQVFQELLGHETLFSSPRTRLGVAFIRLEDFVRDLPDPHKFVTTIEEVVRDLLEAARSFAARKTTPILYVIF